MQRHIVLALGLSVAVSAGFGAPNVRAAPPTEATDVEALKNRLASADKAVVTEALEEIGRSKDPAVIPLLAGFLERGGPTILLQAALKAAGKLRQEALSAPVAPYLRHRDQDTRRAAVRALLRTAGPVAVVALRRGLRSNDAAVRGMSATGLGAMSAVESLDDLFSAFERGVGEAAASIGQLCSPDQCERLAAQLGKAPFELVTSGLDQVLFRPEKDMPENEKIRIIGRLREMGTAQVGRYLADVLERWPADWSPKVRAAIEGAVKATGGGA